ncbi:hypothetical protein AV530_007040 [Patagioenas fasciata monilis]|uniref:Uncharacterized protein n=1 Tax=Patagioenas fasciata monilis TaxID=372326 RepID=A0A1V4JBS4_PATFA|nr:hypothetical protein AV530_007040 [Patagioenas fasciata monilis]
MPWTSSFVKSPRSSSSPAQTPASGKLVFSCSARPDLGEGAGDPRPAGGDAAAGEGAAGGSAAVAVTGHGAGVGRAAGAAPATPDCAGGFINISQHGSHPTDTVAAQSQSCQQSPSVAEGLGTFTLPRMMGPNTEQTAASPCDSTKWKSQWDHYNAHLTKEHNQRVHVPPGRTTGFCHSSRRGEFLPPPPSLAF